MPASQELRIGLVMNGGVSLAVWMGGVTRELDRLRRREGVYGELQALTAVDARIDVIAGASAGGINGAVLAMAIARGRDVQTIRGLWMRRGSIADLLRDPLARDSKSLLKGDEGLLDGLREALGQVGNGSPEGNGSPPPLHLTITGTSLTGQVKGYVDHFGAVIPDIDHRLRFQFRRGPVGDPPETGDFPDDFAGEDVVGRIALAARSSASFPGAFEPSFCPTEKLDATHPGMAQVAGLDAARWVIDGGVLVNTPFLPALDAISTLPAEGPVRRVLAYVVPHLVPETLPADDHTAPPTGREVISAALSRLPRVQSISHELEAIQDSNRQADRRREARAATLGTLSGTDLETAAATLLPSYLESRSKSAADDISMLVLDARRPPPSQVRTALREAPDAGLPGRLRSDFADAAGGAWVPDQAPAGGWRTLAIDPWQWGLAPVEHAGNVALDALRRAVAMPALAGDATVLALRGDVFAALSSLRAIRRRTEAHWSESDPGDARGAAETWQASFGADLGALAANLADALGRLWARLGPQDASTAGLRNALDTLVADPDGRPLDGDDIVRRLLALDVVQRASGADLGGVEQPIELVLISADAASNAFRPGTPVEHKLAGLQAGHFGAFYKQSWRANDWMWGRQDGADRLVRTLVDPRRLRRRLDEGTTAAALAEEVHAIACGGEYHDYLETQWDAGPVTQELGTLSDDSVLAATYAALARRVQLEIVVEEVPLVRQAVEGDTQAGAARGPGAEWAESAAKAEGAPALVEAFVGCTVGSERMTGDVGSDLFTRVSAQGLAVAGSLLSSAVPRPKLIQPVLATLRGVLLALHLLAKGVLMDRRSASFAVAAVLAAGAVLLALALLGAGIPGAFAVVGATILVAGVALGALRRTWARLVMVALAFVVAVAGAYGIREWSGRPGFVDPLASVVAVAIMVLAAMTLGLAARPRASAAATSRSSSAS